MPHKRLNHSAKVVVRKKMGYDLPPGKDDQIPRSMALALGIDDGRNPKRKRDGGGEDTGERTKRRKGSGDGTEDPKSISRKGKSVGVDRMTSKPAPRRDMPQDGKKGDLKDPTRKVKRPRKSRPSEVVVVGKGKTEFAEREDRRRVNDVAEAPPSLSRLPRKATKDGTLGRLPVSESVRKVMEAERQRAIDVYRQMKQKRANVSGAT